MISHTISISKTIASELLSIGAIKLSPEKPFKWASGWNSPIYCDNRLSLSYPPLRNLIKNALAAEILMHFPQVEAISGVATAGIPQGALVADYLNLPFSYVRSAPKGHGMTNVIEGKVEKNQKIVVIEDLVSTGSSSLKAVEDLRNAGADVLGMVCIFTYQFRLASENFANQHVELKSLSDYTSLLEVAQEKQIIAASDFEMLSQWRQDPANWRK